MNEEYIAPSLLSNGFNCPYCNAFSHQIWYENINASKKSSTGGYSHYQGTLEELNLCVCDKCEEISIWLNDKMIYPKSSIASLPIDDMPEDVKEDFLEARNIVNDSPRGSAALLRLGLQKLMLHLGEKGENINQDIGNLVKKGLPVSIQQAADLLRVIGNEAVHPGELDLKDDKKQLYPCLLY